MGEPARGYVRKPFGVGNTAGLRHGAWSPKLIEPAAEQLVADLLAMAGEQDSPVSYLTDPSYKWAILRWARVAARVDRISSWLLERFETDDRPAELDDEGEVRGAANQLLKYDAQAERLESKLGLDPQSRFRMGRDVAAAGIDLARLWAEQDEESEP